MKTKWILATLIFTMCSWLFANYVFILAFFNMTLAFLCFSVFKLEEETAAKGIEVIPPFLLSITDLPPSLLPLHPEGWKGQVSIDWG